MGKKQKISKKVDTRTGGISLFWFPHDVRGFLTLSFACILCLSLISFAISPDSKNMLGLMGLTVGWFFHALFGLGSYPLAIYIGWIGWRKFFQKSLNHMLLKGVYFAAALFSLCTLLSLIECNTKSLSGVLEQLFYPGLWVKKKHFHLGGTPFYYLYCDLPFYNMHHSIQN